LARELIKQAAVPHTTVQDTKYRTAKPTARQQANYVSFDELHAEALRLSRMKEYTSGDCGKHMHLVLLSMLAHLSPTRRDLGSMRLFFSTKPTAPGWTKAHGTNYVMLMPHNGVFFLQRWNKTGLVDDMEPVTTPLPQPLLKILHRSLRRFPRKLLLLDSMGMPFSKLNSYGKFFTRVFQQHFGGRACSVSLWCHAVVNKVVVESRASRATRQRIAREILHNVETQRTMYPLAARERSPRIRKPHRVV
jgi:predicted DNA-binding protein (UPF0251 family)